MLVSSKPALLAHLRRKIDSLEGAQRRFSHIAPICETIDNSLPYKGLPLGCIHEVKGDGLASAIAFASLLSARISQKGAILYVAPDRSFYPLGVLPSDVKPEHWIHVRARRSKDLAWTMLEAMRCSEVKAVLAVTTAADLTFCRRLQLAAESSGATGFLLNPAASLSAGSAITRWRVSSAKAPHSTGFDEVLWKLELLYCRGGRPGKWTIAWKHGNPNTFECLSEISARPMQRVTLAPATAALAG